MLNRFETEESQRILEIRYCKDGTVDFDSSRIFTLSGNPSLRPKVLRNGDVSNSEQESNASGSIIEVPSSNPALEIFPDERQKATMR